MKLTAVNQQTLRDLFDDLATAGKNGGPLGGTTRAGIEMVIKMVFGRAPRPPIPGIPAAASEDADRYQGAIGADQGGRRRHSYRDPGLQHPPAGPPHVVTGMRPQEMLALQRDIVDLDASRLHVHGR